ncbi:cystathionine gamma-synthase/cystathionine gamma-lyase/cystathionine beta-lyase [Glycomyces sambucus]|uniref:homocysteine desulfhydrase n=1 Tax=Glycomyces sambucus TaxID=380244 RepID=A0A1G9M925_9ACTN|nr:aminotransferase class I/II-fold pyridoxal phosphate-dependent enzyme [Glycomyces sambucus]SDL70624.1 cystathionine gamma-synthase/cystathionine gamma-lyase/cystathionine beta-lyase [Glycomyces sambucus]
MNAPSHDTATTAFETLAVHAAEPRPAHGGSVVHPLYQGTVFESVPGESYDELKYIRLNTNPSQQHLHEKLAALEGAEAAVATASGMAAITTTLLATLAAGDHVIAAGSFYGGTHHFLTEQAPRLGWNVDFVGPDDHDAWAEAMRPRTKAFLVETISNPLARVADLAGIAAFSREHGITSIIDNTFATPVVFRPHTIGFDLVCHSATKALNGHSDLVAGVVTGTEEAIGRIRHVLNLYGGSLDPHAGFLLARGLKTLALRVRQQNTGSLALARFLEGHKGIAQVNHPGLESHPDHARATELFDGYGSVFSFRPTGGVEAAESLLKGLRLPYVAPSLGGVESLVTRPAVTSHAGMSAEEREAEGIHDDLIRFSTGIEAPDDLIADFAQALGA